MKHPIFLTLPKFRLQIVRNGHINESNIVVRIKWVIKILLYFYNSVKENTSEKQKAVKRHELQKPELGAIAVLYRYFHRFQAVGK